jgi:eukaryotic-like serine/threonine-protein kinase
MPIDSTEDQAYASNKFSVLLERQERGWQAGTRPPIEQLATGLSENETGVEQLLLLICNEVSLRQAAGEQPQLAEYQQRFPQLAGPLRVQWTVDRFLDSHSRNRSTADLSRDATPPVDGSGTVGDQLADQPYQQAKRQTIADARYELDQVIGRGGMGVVYRARDTRLDRWVAVKMLRNLAPVKYPASTTSARFHQEAETLARLAHPNIVPIYDVGPQDKAAPDSPQPYLVMEYCPAGSLADYLSGTPLEARTAARLVRAIAEGVAAAHQAEIVHRDLKPSNILLAGQHPHLPAQGSSDQATVPVQPVVPSMNHSRPELGHFVPRITDFGLAKQIDATHPLTESGDLLGTPSYMAPEQLTPASVPHPKLSDVYSLGAILYECLTGRPPIRGTSFLETLELVRTQEPVTVRKLQPRVPTDLATIVDKCLQRNPGHRYASAAELADDLQRFLDGRSILAKPSPWWRRVGKAARRHPTAATASIIATAALLALLVGWAAFTTQLQSAQATAEQERDVAQLQAERAERNAGWAMEAVDKLITQVGDQRLAATPQSDQVRKELLQTAVDFCLRFAAERDNADPDARNEAALAYRRLAKIHRALGDRAQWLESLEIAAGLHRQLITDYPDNLDYLIECGRTLNNLANISPDRLQVLEEAIGVKLALVAREPQSAEYRSSLALSLANIGKDYRVQDPEKAEEVYRQAEELLQGLVQQFPADLSYRNTALTLYGNWTAAHVYAGKFDDALRTATAQRSLAESDPRGLAHYEVRQQLARSFESMGVVQGYIDRPSALKSYAAQRELIQQLIDEFPERVELKVDLLRCSFNLLNVLRDSNDYGQVEELGLVASQHGDEWLARYPDNVELQRFAAQVQGIVALAFLEQGKFQLAKTWFDKSSPYCIAWMDRENGDPVLVSMSNNYRAYLALVDYYQGETEKGVSAMQATNSRMRSILKEQPEFHEAKRLFVFSAANIVLMNIRQEKTEEALRFAEDLATHHDWAHPWTGRLLVALARAASGDYRDALQVLAETPGSEVQSDMWPDRVSVATACYAMAAVQRDSLLTKEEQQRLVDQLSAIAARELQLAEEETFFRFPLNRDALTKYPEYDLLKQ